LEVIPAEKKNAPGAVGIGTVGTGTVGTGTIGTGTVGTGTIGTGTVGTAQPSVSAPAVQAGGMELKIHARGVWRYVSARPDGPKEGQKLVFRSAAELVAATPFKNLDAPAQVVEKQATAELAKALKVDTIDWAKQMVIVVTAGGRPTGGWKIDISAVKGKGKTVEVHWKATPPTGFATQAFTHPSVVALTDRVEGEVKFVT